MNTTLSTTQTSRRSALKPAARIGRALAQHFDTALVLSLLASSAAYAVVTLAQVV